VASNISRLEATRRSTHSRTSSNLVEYRTLTRPMLISMGKYEGALVWGSFFVTGVLASLMKEFVEWKETNGF
jgi:hypothetical protein